MLRDEEPIPVTLSAHRPASPTSTCSRPAIRWYGSRCELLTEESLALRRFGVARLRGLPPGRATWSPSTSPPRTGLRPLLELWATAVDARPPAPSTRPSGDALLSALADGTPRPTLPCHRRRSRRRCGRVAAAAARAPAGPRTEPERCAANESLVDGRIVAQLRSLDLKLARAGEILDGRITDPGVRRLTEGRVRTLRRRRDAVPATLDRSRGLTVTLTPVAVVLVSSD